MQTALSTSVMEAEGLPYIMFSSRVVLKRQVFWKTKDTSHSVACLAESPVHIHYLHLAGNPHFSLNSTPGLGITGYGSLPGA